jgi:hypothetical protein
VGHIHHIPIVCTGCGFGVTVLGRCAANTGPAAVRGATAPRMSVVGLQ